MIPVSYTHLDVYKRQIKVQKRKKEEVFAKANELLLKMGLEGRGDAYPYPVSYTHLDVYKRQILSLYKLLRLWLRRSVNAVSPYNL